MDYFSILNLKEEPFSNSPDPELFYPSRIHVECLQKLEMAVRLRRGLNVVLGEVGTGKTTLCRKLIQQFSTARGDDKMELHLVLDPSFSDAHEFLSVIAGDFGLTASDGVLTDWQLKELIKGHLFEKGVKEAKTVVLLIDEGQKLPDFCLEILREFLNYETNDSKLLQIVIFAQLEFKKKIDERANFANRINLFYSLKPLGFRETSRIVKYRIDQASVNEKGRALFTWPGLLALYRATGGNPRSINMLCHHVLIALIIQNRVKATSSLVRACSSRMTLERQRGPIIGPAVLAALLLVVTLACFSLIYYRPALKEDPTKGASPAPPSSTTSEKFWQLTVPASTRQEPVILPGSVLMKRGSKSKQRTKSAQESPADENVDRATDTVSPGTDGDKK